MKELLANSFWWILGLATLAFFITQFIGKEEGQVVLAVAIFLGWLTALEVRRRRHLKEKEEQLREEQERLEQEWLTCKGCNQNMLEVDTCLCEYVVSRKDGKTYKRDSTFSCQGGRCSKCNVVEASGNYHHVGCDDEVCPRCGGFAWSCDCDIEIVPPEVSYNREDS